MDAVGGGYGATAGLTGLSGAGDSVMPAAPPITGKGRRKNAKNKRDKNRPKQPLSAYNIFFKDERAKMLLEAQKAAEEDAEDKSDAEEDAKSKEEEEAPVKEEEGGAGEKEPKEEGDEGTKEEGGEGEAEEKSKKRKREATPGKIGFEKMAKTIAKRWKEISKEDLAKYEARAQEDQKRYKSELAIYLQKKRDETVTDKDGVMGGMKKE